MKKRGRLEKIMNYGEIKTIDVANGPGVRVTLFVSGCTHHCFECFQPETWDFSFGQEFTKETQKKIMDALAPEFIEGMTVLGGEPFEPDNQRCLLPLIKEVRETYPEKNIWMFSGYLFDELTGREEGTGRARCEVTDEILSLIDVLVDGEYEADKRNLALTFRGSENQRLINVPESLKSEDVVLWGE